MPAKKLRKAVFPVAGMGSRFLPVTKASPKEMLPIVDKPLIQYAVEEAYEAGIRHMIFVTGRNKRAIEDHFDTAYELAARAAATPGELTRRTKATMDDVLAIDDHDAAVARELETQLWSMEQPEFAERLAALQARIKS